ncbi:MAG: cytochrome c oxidase accessory protein CcoG, partial [Rhodobacteraceae bacterium]|nr:cytochrome c oxidase accessory protein CcoG [Paracoccaceae bacterium]
KPRDLIGYLALTDETRERAGQPPRSVWSHVFRARTILYTVLWGGVGIGLIVALFLRSPIDVNVTPVRNPTFVTLSDGSIRNAYDLRLRNMHGEDARFTIAVTSDAFVTLSLEGVEGLTVTVPANETMSQRVYLTAGPGTRAAASDRTDVRIWVEELGTTNRVHHDTIFNGKED